MNNVSANQEPKTMNNSSFFIRKVYQRFYITTVVNLFLRTSVLSIGVFFAGNMLGPSALGAAGLLLPVSFLYLALGELFGMGCATLISRYIGENDFGGAKKTVTAAYISNFLICLVVAVLGFAFMDTLLNLLNIPPDMQGEAAVYIGISLIGGFFSTCVDLGSSLLKFDGKMTALILAIAISPLCTVTLTYGLIQFAGLGLRAVAIGVNAGYVITALVMLYRVAAKSKVLGFAKIKAAECVRIFAKTAKEGISTAATNICITGLTIITNGLIVKAYGQLALSAYSAFGSLTGLLAAVSAGSAVALVQLAGVMSAERDSASVKQLVKISLGYGLSLAAITGAVLIVFSKPIASAFGMGFDEAYGMMRSVLFTLALLIVLDVLVSTLYIFYNTIGRNFASLFIVIARKFVLAVVLLYALSGAFGLDGVWASIWACAALTIVFTLVYSLIVSAKNKHLTKVFLIDTEAEKNGTYMSFSAENSVEDIVDCSQRISGFCQQNQLNKAQSNLISLAIEEMLLLIREHSLKDSQEAVNVRVLLYQEEVVMRIRSGGLIFNPLAFYRDLKLSEKLTLADALEYDEYIGLKMVVDTVKNVDYRRTFGVNNLTVTIGGSKS